MRGACIAPCRESTTKALIIIFSCVYDYRNGRYSHPVVLSHFIALKCESDHPLLPPFCDFLQKFFDLYFFLRIPDKSGWFLIYPFGFPSGFLRSPLNKEKPGRIFRCIRAFHEEHNMKGSGQIWSTSDFTESFRRNHPFCDDFQYFSKRPFFKRQISWGKRPSEKRPPTLFFDFYSSSRSAYFV